jgi:hypothetical protein
VTTTTPRIVVEFAGRRVPVRLTTADVPDDGGFSTNVTCLHSVAGAVAYGAAVIVLYAGDGWDAGELAIQLRRLGYQDVKVERERGKRS